jgi:hypothetical protein
MHDLYSGKVRWPCPCLSAKLNAARNVDEMRETMCVSVEIGASNDHIEPQLVHSHDQIQPQLMHLMVTFSRGAAREGVMMAIALRLHNLQSRLYMTGHSYMIFHGLYSTGMLCSQGTIMLM